MRFRGHNPVSHIVIDTEGPTLIIMSSSHYIITDWSFLLSWCLLFFSCFRCTVEGCKQDFVNNLSLSRHIERIHQPKEYKVGGGNEKKPRKFEDTYTLFKAHSF